MTRHLVIFARAPQSGRVKRRLARGIGSPEALRFYRAILDRTIRSMSRDPRWTLWLFVTPDTSLRDPAWRGAVPVARVRPQGRGDLGQRMLTPFRTLPPGPAVLVGSDIPGMQACHIDRAFRQLARHDLVFGPASDGGFWLFGARRTGPIPRGLFTGVRWSTAHALADSRRNIPQHVAVALADMLDDIDTVDDLRRFEASRRRRAS